MEQGPIRPPSEAQSLLLRVTRNCPWNRCEFCHIYKGSKFSLRSVAEVKQDIDRVSEMASELRSISWQMGFGGEISSSVASSVLHGQTRPEGYRSVVLWLYKGGKNVFLQDADNLAVKTRDLVEILAYLKSRCPSIERITTYSRAKTVARKTVAELQELHEAGLSRIHIGLESGHDPLLQYVQKGVTAREHIDAGIKVRQAGISLSEYIMPGLGGRSMWREHAVETARVLNRIDPDFIRVRTLKVLDIMPLHRKVESCEMELLSDDEMIAEERLLIETIDGIHSMFISDHILNLLEELDGKFPEAKQTMLATIDRYLAMDLRLRNNYRLGRRAGIYRRLDDMDDPGLRAQGDDFQNRVEGQGPDRLEQVISEMMASFI